MSQKYLMRYPLIIGQGALGTQENNDLIASSRYTESKPSVFADLMMKDYNKNPVPVKETYNGEFMEPVVLPSLFPNALCNGRQAIGVSMAHSSPPHNLTEVCNAIIAYIENNDIKTEEIMRHLPGPDFPLGGTIINSDEIKEAFETGKTRVSLKVRGDYTLEQDKITFTSIPYRTYRNKIKEQLEMNIDQFDDCLEDFNDESNIGNNKMVFYAKPGKVNVLLNKLFKFTELQANISYNMNFIVNGTPKVCSIIDLIKAYVNHQNVIIEKIAQVDLQKATGRRHLLEGISIALKDIDKVIDITRNSANKDQAAQSLISYFNIDKEQATAILDIKISRLTTFDKNELAKEISELSQAIDEYARIIDKQDYRYQVLIKKLIELRDKYGDERRTKITQIEEEEIEEQVEVESENCFITLMTNGLVKRSTKAQKKTIKGFDDIVFAEIETDTNDNLLVFTNFGNYYRILASDIPDKNIPIQNLIKFQQGEEIKGFYSMYKKENENFLFFVTKMGMVKKTALQEYLDIKKKNGVPAIGLKSKDEVVSILLIEGTENILLVNKAGYMVKIGAQEIQDTSRKTLGVKGIKINKKESALCAFIPNENEIAIISENGSGKKINEADISLSSRALRGTNVSKNVNISASFAIADQDSVLIIGDGYSSIVQTINKTISNNRINSAYRIKGEK